MPAPTEIEIRAVLNKEVLKAAMKKALLDGTNPFQDRQDGKRQALWKVDDSGLPDNPAVQVQTELPDAIDDLADAMAEALDEALPKAIAEFWDVWQKAQSVAVVTPPLVVTGFAGAVPVTGTAQGTVTGPGALP